MNTGDGNHPKIQETRSKRKSGVRDLAGNQEMRLQFDRGTVGTGEMVKVVAQVLPSVPLCNISWN
jgi:hypothetical protein